VAGAVEVGRSRGSGWKNSGSVEVEVEVEVVGVALEEWSGMLSKVGGELGGGERNTEAKSCKNLLQKWGKQRRFLQDLPLYLVLGSCCIFRSHFGHFEKYKAKYEIQSKYRAKNKKPLRLWVHYSLLVLLLGVCWSCNFTQNVRKKSIGILNIDRITFKSI